MFDYFDVPEKAFSILSRYCGALPEKYEPAFIKSITWPGGKLGTPYLPDGYASGAAFTYLPGGFERKSSGPSADIEVSVAAVAGSTLTFGFELDHEGPAKKGKPFAQPFYFRLTTGKERKKPETSGRRLTVTLPPGEQQLIRISSAPTEDLGIFAQVQNAFEAKQETFLIQPRVGAKLGKADWSKMRGFLPRLIEVIKTGQFWPLTPQKIFIWFMRCPSRLCRQQRTQKGNRSSDLATICRLHHASQGASRRYCMTRRCDFTARAQVESMFTQSGMSIPMVRELSNAHSSKATATYASPRTLICLT